MNYEDEMDGISVKEEILAGNIKVTRLNIFTEEAGKKLGKDIGNYITIEFGTIFNVQEDFLSILTNAVSDELRKILHLKPSDNFLIIGIGNRNILADSLGPRTIDGVLASRHAIKYMEGIICNDIWPVSAIAPGALGQTGIETSRIIKAIVKEISPSAVIAIDSLCAGNLNRLCRTIQIADTGLAPGVMRETGPGKINLETIGVPIIAIGVPVVIEAACIVENVRLNNRPCKWK